MTDPDAPAPARPGRLSRFRTRVRALPGGRLAWRVGVTVVGVAVIVIGIVLLPLPGPGWLIIFAGFGILATEYTWAARMLRFLRGLVAQWTRWLAARHWWVRLLLGGLTLLVLVGIAVAAWYVGGHPGL
jgi:uncharacterized protein (TIGR02611 family)